MDLNFMSELALELVKKCLEEKNLYLDLGNCRLADDDFKEGSSLDTALRRCGHLEKLNLSNGFRGRIVGKTLRDGDENELNVLPPCVLTLTKLKQLICRG